MDRRLDPQLDFLNEADNQQRLRDLIAAEKVQGVYVPEVYHEMCTRRVLVSEWIDGTKLSDCPKDEIRELIGVGQECFLVQLLQVGLEFRVKGVGVAIYRVRV